jgi:diguanylate cyclase (GGDEF)-like protein
LFFVTAVMALKGQEIVLREARAKAASNSLVGDASGPNRREAAGRDRTGARLASTVLAYLPLGVAVIDADQRLLFWNEQGAALFGVPPLMAGARPRLAEILAGVSSLTPRQRDAIVAFAEAHVAAGDRAEPGDCLRISLGRDRRIAIQMRGIGSDRWLLAINDGTLPIATARPGAVEDGVVWLDALTGLSNRRHFIQVLRDLLANASSESNHTVVMIDLDRFQPINDTLGHSIGDALLCLVAQRLRRETRDDDLLIRLGGDEFVILITSTARAEPLARRVVDVLSRPFLVEGHIVTIGASIGIACFPAHGASVDDLMRHAELALYDAKSAGRHTWRMFDPVMAVHAHTRRDLEAGLRNALAIGELSLVYQPQMDVRTQALVGFEALLRWNHPVFGEVSPAIFIPVAEEIGCIVAFGEWVLRTACKQAVGWPATLSVAVNVSPFQLQESDRLFDAVEAALQVSGLPAERLELEITESALIVAETRVLATLHRLRDRGIRIAMDDFGTGHSSLSRLRLFPFSKIKIDQRFVARLGVDDEAAAVIRAIVTLGQGLGMATIAEGVETADQAARVEAGGCTQIQGYLLSQPIRATQVDVFLRQYDRASDRIFTTA